MGSKFNCNHSGKLTWCAIVDSLIRAIYILVISLDVLDYKFVLIWVYMQRYKYDSARQRGIRLIGYGMEVDM